MLGNLLEPPKRAWSLVVQLMNASCAAQARPPLTCQAASPVLGHAAESDRAICLHVLSSVCAVACKGRPRQLLLRIMRPCLLHRACCQLVHMREADGKRKVAAADSKCLCIPSAGTVHSGCCADRNCKRS